jgi:hypothetical protein
MDMKQQEIEFFWPLTEQILLDLDYAPCEPPKLTVSYTNGDTTGFAFYSTGSWGTVSNVNIKAKELTIELVHMPWYRKLAYKIMGFKWK